MDNSSEKKIFTGIECMRAVTVNFCRDVNFDALLTQKLHEKCTVSEEDAILELAQKLDLSPEICKEPDFPKAVDDYSGPLPILLKNGNWVCLIDGSELKSNAEDVLVCDPLAHGKKFISVQYDKLIENYGGTVIKFKHLLTGKESGNTLGDDRPDIGHLLQYCDVRSCQILDTPESARQILRGALANVANTERKNKPRERRLLALFD